MSETEDGLARELGGIKWDEERKAFHIPEEVWIKYHTRITDAFMSINTFVSYLLWRKCLELTEQCPCGCGQVRYELAPTPHAHTSDDCVCKHCQNAASSRLAEVTAQRDKLTEQLRKVASGIEILDKIAKEALQKCCDLHDENAMLRDELERLQGERDALAEQMQPHCECGHSRSEHDEEQPYRCNVAYEGLDETRDCYECGCEGFTYPPNAATIRAALSQAQQALRDEIQKLPRYPVHLWCGGRNTKEFQQLIGLQDVLVVIAEAALLSDTPGAQAQEKK